jgi:hypothetical protein
MSNILTVERDWQSSYNMLTILRDSKGAVKKIINSSLQQPKRKDKTIEIKGTVYLLDWSNTPKEYIKVKDRI